MSESERKAVSFNLRLPPADYDRLVALGDHLAITPTSVIRMLVKQRHDKMMVEKMAFDRKGTAESEC
jgi:hypothetical protein